MNETSNDNDGTDRIVDEELVESEDASIERLHVLRQLCIGTRVKVQIGQQGIAENVTAL